MRGSGEAREMGRGRGEEEKRGGGRGRGVEGERGHGKLEIGILRDSC